MLRPYALVVLLCACGDKSSSDTDTDTDTDTDADTDSDTDTDTDTDADTDTDTGRPCAETVALTYKEGGCLGYPDMWDFKIDNQGCAASAVLNAWDTVADDWDEQHPMTLGAEGPDGAYQDWRLGPLPESTPAAAWQSGVNTTFDCADDAASLTFAVRVFAADGSLEDCWLWGHDAAAAVAGTVTAVNSDAASSFATCTIQPY